MKLKSLNLNGQNQNKMKRNLLIIVPLLLLVGCTTLNNEIELKNGEVAHVFGKVITQNNLDRESEIYYTRFLPKGYELTKDEELRFKTQVLNSMIQKHMFNIKMDELGITANRDVIDREIDLLIQDFDSKEEFLKQIELNGYTFERFYDEFLYETRLEELRKWIENENFTVSEEEILNYYNKNLEEQFSKPGKIVASHIIILTENRDKESALEKILEIKEEISMGLSFYDAAKKYSEGPSREVGGSLRPFTKGQMVKEFEDVALTIPLDKVSDPVLTQFGYHLILVKDRQDSLTTPLEDAREYIESNVRYNNFFNQLKSEAQIIKIDWANETE